MTNGEIFYLVVVLATFSGFAAGIGVKSLQFTRESLMAARRDNAHGDAMAFTSGT